MAKVFLSYVREDLSAARKVAAALERAGHEVWWDRHIRGGAEFAQEIDRALEAAAGVVVLWSKQSITSAWVRDEAGAGRDSGRLVPVRIDDCTPPLGFRQYQAVDLPAGGKGNSQAAFQELSDAISALAGAPRPAPQTDHGVGKLSRRLLIGAGAATAIAASAGGLIIYRGRSSGEAPSEVQPLMAQAKQLMNQDTREGQYQAAALYQRVTEMAPDYADGWGWLGYTYGVMSHFRDRTESMALRAKAEGAARHALELDPKSAFGELALSVALPLIGHWAEREERLQRALMLRPNDDELLLLLGVALKFAGRASEAVPVFSRIKHKPLTPAESTNVIHALWTAGRLPELDQAIAEAVSLYPTQAGIWFTRLNIAAYAGRVSAVSALCADVEGRPSEVTDAAVERFMNLVQAVQGREPALIDGIMANERSEARTSAGRAALSISNASALDRLDDAFTLANAYYFGRGFVIPDWTTKGSAFSPEQRDTQFLFEPETKPMRGDPRFEQLVRELGLDRYWRESGKPPDSRHIPGL